MVKSKKKVDKKAQVESPVKAKDMVKIELTTDPRAKGKEIKATMDAAIVEAERVQDEAFAAIDTELSGNIHAVQCLKEDDPAEYTRVWHQAHDKRNSQRHDAHMECHRKVEAAKEMRRLALIELRESVARGEA